jgi:hypothetical protein
LSLLVLLAYVLLYLGFSVFHTLVRSSTMSVVPRENSRPVVFRLLVSIIS